MLILGMIGIAFVIIGVMFLMSPKAPNSKPKSKKSQRHIDPPGWGTPHGF